MGSDGKASAPILAPPRLDPGAVDPGRDVGADEGFEDGAEEDWLQGIVVILLLDWGRELEGSSGKANLFEVVGATEAEPQDLVCDTDDREDWAVELLSFRTRFDFVPELVFVEEDADVVAQFRGNESDGRGPPGREG